MEEIEVCAITILSVGLKAITINSSGVFGRKLVVVLLQKPLNSRHGNLPLRHLRSKILCHVSCRCKPALGQSLYVMHKFQLLLWVKEHRIFVGFCIGALFVLMPPSQRLFVTPKYFCCCAVQETISRFSRIDCCNRSQDWVWFRRHIAVEAGGLIL
jgi:hypothetical protein